MGEMFLFKLSNISKVFKSKSNTLVAVDRVSLELPYSGLVSIEGKSGCGKSTLLNMISGIEKPSKGIIFYEGKKLKISKKKRMSQYRLNDISMIYQHYNLFGDLSVIDNIALPLRIAGVNRLKANKEALNLISKFKLDGLSHKKASLLSGGEKQRVAIMRALITKPKVILCDEPTGALDETNSEQIMSILKDVSKEKLVLMVSHNHQLIEKYSDRIIEMKNGSIVNDLAINKIDSKNKTSKKRTKVGITWIFNFIKELFKKNVFKEFFSFVSLTIGIISICVGVGFIVGSEKSQNDALTHNLAIGNASVSETSYFSVSNSPLQFKKNVRPRTELIDRYLGDFETLSIQPNTNYFFSPYPTGHFYDEQIEGFEMVPILNEFIDNNDVYPGIAGSFKDNNLINTIVNRDFLKLFSNQELEDINNRFLVSYKTSISYYTGDENNPFITEDFSYSLRLNIVSVIDEFSFMNSPKIYYSYDALVDYLKNETLPNISRFLGYNVSVFDYLIATKGDTPESSYSSFIFMKNLDEYQLLFSKIKELTNNEETLQIESNVYTISESYKSFISSFKDALIFFLAIAFIGVLFILGMVSLSNFLENKKQSAILSCLGAPGTSISAIYLTYNLIISIIAFVVAIFSSFYLRNILNIYIFKSFGLTKLISIPFNNFYGMNHGFIFLCLAVVIFGTFLFTLIPILIYKNNSISEELRDE